MTKCVHMLRALGDVQFQHNVDPPRSLPIAGGLQRQRLGRFLVPALIVALGLMMAQQVPAQTFTIVHAFNGTNDGAAPIGGLIVSGSTLYGTANDGGTNGSGTVFAINTNGTSFKILHNFGVLPNYTNSDGAYPSASLTLSGSMLYGTAEYGGTWGHGTVFSVKTDGTGFSTLHSFNLTDGDNPYAGLIISGNTLYGTTELAGTNGYGNLFAIKTDGTGFTNLYNFSGGSDGDGPVGGLILSGNTLYGTANGGGSSSYGTVFAINTNGTSFSTLHSFNGSDGEAPIAGLILSGNVLYGTANRGGVWGNGTVFAIKTDGTGYTILHSFSEFSYSGIAETNSDGGDPRAGLILSGYTLYGTAYQGGSSGDGTVFAVNTDGTGFTNLYNFTGGSDGANPVAGLISSDNILYGTAPAGGTNGYGTVFALGNTIPLLDWENPAPVTYGTPLTSNQLDAIASVAGSLAYTPTNGTVLNAGTYTLSAIFTPSNTVEFSSTTDAVNLVVSRASLTVSAANANRLYGQTNPVFTGTIVGVTNGDNITAIYTCSATINSPGGTYAIIPAMLDPDDRETNYVVSLINGFLAIGVAGPTNFSLGASSNTPAYTFTTFAGFAGAGSADGAGSAALFNSPEGVVSDGAGNLFIVDSGNDTIRKVTPGGVVSTIAGLAGNPGAADGIGSNARFNFATQILLNPDPYKTYSLFSGITMDRSGNLYVSDSGNGTIRMITPAGTNWIVNTLGTGTNSFSHPSGIAVDNMGNLYVADDTGTMFEIRKVTPTISQGLTNWVVSTIARSTARIGGIGYSGVAVDGAGNVYTVLAGQEILQITPGGEQNAVTNITAGNNCGVAVDSLGNLYVATDQSSILKIAPIVSGGQTSWVVSTFAGSGVAGSADGTGTNAQFNAPQGVALDGGGNFYVTDTGNNLVRKISSAAVVGTLAGALGTGSADGSGASARFDQPIGLAVDNSGNIYVADTGNNTIRTITPAGVVNTLGGLAGNPGSADGAGSNARFNGPEGVAVDNDGNIFVADTGNNTIREVTPAGAVSTLAGNPATSGFNDGMGTNALFYNPSGIAVNSSSNLYVMDQGNGAIRNVLFNGSQWVVNTVATNRQGHGFLSYPFGQGTCIALDSVGNLYLTVTSPNVPNTPSEANFSIAVVNTNTVGTDAVTMASIGLTYTNANPAPSIGQLYHPAGVTIDNMGNLYVADCYSSQIFKITSAGVLSPIGGSFGNVGSADGAGVAALFDIPSGIAVDTAGNLYVADTFNNTIRKGTFTAYGAANLVATTPPSATNSLTVWLEPANVNGQWRFPWEVAWHNSGDTESNLVPGEYSVQFNTVPGYLVIPFSGPVGVTNNTVVTNQYYPTISTEEAGNGGTLTVTLGPNPPNGAAWGFLGEGTPAFPSGFNTNLAAGTYLITFAPVSGRVTPPNLSVQVQSGQTAYISENYLLAQSAPSGVLVPGLVPTNEISDLIDYPFGFDGQLETDVGYGSGVAVQANVVLTAAHLVFNDQSLSYASQAYWSGAFQPQPIAARGWYMLSGYASQRTNDMEVYAPGTYTPQAANMDVAALYFLSPVAGGGYSGYLPSDASPNTWLTSSALKMLVGFPVDASEFDVTNVVPGQMYQTQPQPYPLALSTEPVADQQVYTATWFLGYPGDSGGPLYVQFDGYYYPAAVYLATLYDGTTPYASAVRAIDSEVVNLITNAAVLGDSGTNNNGGGVVILVPGTVSASNPAYIQVWLLPAAAVQAGAGWRLQGETNFDSAPNDTIAVISTNVTLEFKPIQGWNTPVSPPIEAIAGSLNVISNLSYTVLPPDMSASLINGIGFTGTTGTTYVIQYRTNLLTGQWQPLSTNVLKQGFNKIVSWSPTNPASAMYYRAVWVP